jgi:hypothetical protein
MADKWIAFGVAAVMLGGTVRVQRALIAGEIGSRGVPALDGIEPVDIDPNRWATWTFNLKRQSLDPPGYRGIATGYAHVVLLRADVERLVAATVKVAPEAEPAAIAEQIESERYPGRPSVKRQIVAKMQERFAAGEACGSLADEARWLMQWAQDEFPDDTSAPTKPASVENQIRKEFRRLEAAAPLNTPIK